MKMSIDTEIKDSSYYVDWLEKSISEGRIRCYEYSDFKNIQPVGSGSFASVVRVTLKNTGIIFALKSFNMNKITLKEVVNEVLDLRFILRIKLMKYLFLYYFIYAAVKTTTDR